MRKCDGATGTPARARKCVRHSLVWNFVAQRHAEPLYNRGYAPIGGWRSAHSPDHRTRRWPGRGSAPVRTAEKRRLRRSADASGAAWAIRTLVNNRVGHELIRTLVANHRLPRWDRLRRRFSEPVSRCSQSLRRSRATVAPRESVRPEDWSISEIRPIEEVQQHGECAPRGAGHDTACAGESPPRRSVIADGGSYE